MRVLYIHLGLLACLMSVRSVAAASPENSHELIRFMSQPNSAGLLQSEIREAVNSMDQAARDKFGDDVLDIFAGGEYPEPFGTRVVVMFKNHSPDHSYGNAQFSPAVHRRAVKVFAEEAASNETDSGVREWVLRELPLIEPAPEEDVVWIIADLALALPPRGPDGVFPVGNWRFSYDAARVLSNFQGPSVTDALLHVWNEKVKRRQEWDPHIDPNTFNADEWIWRGLAKRADDPHAYEVVVSALDNLDREHRENQLAIKVTAILAGALRKMDNRTPEMDQRLLDIRDFTYTILARRDEFATSGSALQDAAIAFAEALPQSDAEEDISFLLDALPSIDLSARRRVLEILERRFPPQP